MKKRIKAKIGVVLMVAAITVVTAAMPASAKYNKSTTSQGDAFMPAAQTYWKYSEQYKFPAGKYWNGRNADSCTDTACTDHRDDNAISCAIRVDAGYPIGYYGVTRWGQCQGFARKLAEDFYGDCQVWVRHNYSSGFQFRFGDQIRIGNNQHSVFVTEVNGNNLKIADCNAGHTCVIRWDVPAKIVNNQLYLSGELYHIDYIERPAMAGDLNGDSYVTIEDILGISQICSGTYNFNGKNADLIKECADLDNNGQVTVTDLIRAYSQFNGTYLRNERYLTSIGCWD